MRRKNSTKWVMQQFFSGHKKIVRKKTLQLKVKKPLNINMF